MKQRTFDFFKHVSHVILVIISVTFTTLLFIQFGEKLYEKLLWGLLGVGLEMIKLYLFLLVKKNLREHDKWIKLAGAMFQFVIYLGIAFVSIIASVGFAMNTIQGQSFAANLQSIDMEQTLMDVESINTEIDTKLRQQSELPTDYVTASDRFTDQIAELRDRRNVLLEEVADMREQLVNRTTESINTFTMLGSLINLSGHDTLYYLMLIMVLFLEICLVATSGDIEEKVNLSRSLDRIMTYIDNLVERDGVRLNSDKVVSEKSGIPLDECKKYKQMLLGISYKGTPILMQGRGGTQSPFSRDSIKKIVRFHLNVTN